MRDSEAHAAEDKRRREIVELKNQSDSLAYQSEKSLNELGDKVDSVQKGRAEELIKDLRDAIAQEDEDKMRALSNDLQQLMMQISQSAYSEPQSHRRCVTPARAVSDEGVVEGEYTSSNRLITSKRLLERDCSGAFCY